MFKKSIAVAMSLVLVLGLCPALALAAGDESLSAASVAAAKTQSSAETVWVRSDLANLKYNKNGLISQHSYQYNGMAGKGTAVESYKYDSKGHLVKYTWKLSKMKSAYNTWIFKYDKKGRLSKRVFYYKKSRHGVASYVYKNKGRTIRSTFLLGGEKVVRDMSLSKAGRVASVKEAVYRRHFGKWRKDNSGKFAYSYDKRGNVTKRTGDFSSWSRTKTYRSATYKNVYDGRGLLVSREIAKGSKVNDTYGYVTGRFSYKQVKVPKKYAEAVRAQQHALVNPSTLIPRFGIDYLLGGSLPH